MFRAGGRLHEAGDLAAARTAYAWIVQSGDAVWAPRAEVQLALLLWTGGDAAGARAAYERLLGSARPDAAAYAALYLGNLLHELGELQPARTAYERAMASDHPDAAPRAASNLGALLAGLGEVGGAKAAYEQALQSVDRHVAAVAAFNLALLLEEQGEVEAAVALYEQAADSGDEAVVPQAEAQLGAHQEAQQLHVMQLGQQHLRTLMESGAPTGAPSSGDVDPSDTSLELHPGDDGTLPVRIRWIAQLDVPEAVAVDGDVVYVADSRFAAFSLTDGTVLWECGHEHALEASGGVVIGTEGTEILRVFAPWEFDLRVDRQSGELMSLESAGGSLPPELSRLPAPPPARFRVEPDLEETIAYWPDGSVAWRLTVESPFVDPQPPVEAADGAIILVTSGQHLILLDPVPEQ